MGIKTELLATAAAGVLKVEPAVMIAGVVFAAIAAVATWSLNRPSRTFTEAVPSLTSTV
jgi:hypothetical protein